MQATIQFLTNNTDAMNAVKEGRASLMGVNSEELKAILDVFSEDNFKPRYYFWR